MIGKQVEALKPQMIDTLKELIRIPAISPSAGGEGEARKARWLEKLIEPWGFDEIKRYDCNKRANIIARIKGKTKKTLWIVTHLDVVSPGDLALWDSNPFEPVVKNEKIYGRGSEDNNQELVASLYACKALLDSGEKPTYNLALAFVSDEETGSDYGIKHLIKKELFKKDDQILVPDSGNEEGSLIEVAEKGMLWLKIITQGKQCHASMPQLGINAFRAGTILGYRLDKELHAKFNFQDSLFSPPSSTFELTKKEANVPNINTIPGTDIFYLDCRILPKYKTEEILEGARKIADEVELETQTKIKIELVQKGEATFTDPSSELVRKLASAIKEVYQIEAKPGGVGGGTCAAWFRRNGLQAVVWSKIDNTCHMPNEYCRISNLVGDAEVYLRLFCK